MIRSLLFAAIFLPACGGAPFSVAFEVSPNEDAGSDAVAVAVIPTPEASSEVPGDTALPVRKDQTVKSWADAGDVASLDASGAETSTEAAAPEAAAPEASGPIVLSPFRCVSPSMGYVACDSGGGWTVRFSGTQTCDYSHPASVGCLQGSKCEFFQNGGTPIEGTCEP